MALAKGIDLEECIAAYKRLGTYTEAAAALGVNESTVRRRVQRAQAAEAAALNDAGYQIDLEPESVTPKEAWDAHARTFERKVSGVISKQWRTIKRGRGPFVIFHQTDVHVDDDGAALKLIEQDIEDSHQLGAIMCHGGDLLNNWPLNGRLAKKWAEQECTMPNALKRAQYYIDIFKPDVWTQGNHEEMNPYLASIIDGWLPENTLTDFWSVNFEVHTPGADPFRAILSHKLQKGSSWFHKMHGHLREMLEGQEADLYMDGHLHCDGVIEHSLPERGIGARWCGLRGV